MPEAESKMPAHPNIEQIRRFLESRESREGRRTSRHLLDCERCRDRAARELRRAEGSTDWLAKVLPYPRREIAEPPRVDIERLVGVLGAAAREVEASSALLEELRSQPLERWPLVFENSSRFHSLALAREIIRAGHREAFDDPARAAMMLLQGIELLDRLDPTRYVERLLDDARGRGWVCLGDCYRIAGDLKAAEGAFHRSKRLLRETADPEELANLDYLLGILRKDQRRFEEALVLFERARRQSEEIGDTEKVVRILTSIGALHNQQGQPEEALPALLDASLMLETTGDRRLGLFVHGNLANCFVELGDYSGAREVADRWREEHSTASESYVRLRWRWIEGRIAAGLGEDDRAESLLAGVRSEYLERGQRYTAAVVSLHLAALYAHQRRNAELKALAEEMIPVIVDQDVPAEAIAALAFLRRAIDQERASEELVANVVRFIERAFNDPSVKFRPADH